MSREDLMRMLDREKVQLRGEIDEIANQLAASTPRTTEQDGIDARDTFLENEE